MKSWFSRSVGMLCLILLLPIIVHSQTQKDMVARWRVAAAEYPIEKQKAIKAGIPLTLKELRKPLPPEKENAALLYHKMRAIHSLDDSIKTLYEFGRKNAPTPQEVEQAQKALAQCSELLKAIHEAVARPKCVFDREWDITSTDSQVFPEFSQARTATALLIGESLLMAHAGKGVGAVQNQVKGFQIARHIASDGTLTGWLVGRAIDDMTLSGMRRILSVRNDAETTHAVAQTIEKEWHPIPLAPAMREEAATQQDMITIARKEGFFPYLKIMMTPDSADDSAGASKMNPDFAATVTKETRSAIKAHQNLLFDANAAYLLQKMQILKEAADLSFVQANAVFTAQDKELAAIPSLPEGEKVLRILANYSTLSFLRLSIQNKALGTTRASLVRAGAAVLAYRAEHDGDLPETLSAALTPVPDDPFSVGQPLQYRKEGEGKDGRFVVYSVGPTGTFDGGKSGNKVTGVNIGCVFRYPFAMQ